MQVTAGIRVFKRKLRNRNADYAKYYTFVYEKKYKCAGNKINYKCIKYSVIFLQIYF